MKLLLSLSILSALMGTELRADSPIVPTVTAVDAREIFSHHLINAEVTPGKETASIDIQYSIQFSNSCMASAQSIVPTITKTSVYNESGKARHHILFVAARGPAKKIACPAVYRPVVVANKVTLKHLMPHERYEVQVLGLTTKSDAYTTFDVVATR